MMADAADQAMTVRDVAGYLNVDEKTVYRLAKRGDLRVSKWPVHGASRGQTSMAGSICRKKLRKKKV